MDKDCWDKFEIWIKFLAAVAAVSIPFIVSYYGNSISTAIKTKELQQQKEQHSSELAQKYVEIAVGILKDNPTQETNTLRNWAIDTINRYSEIKFTDAQRKVLIEKPLISITGVGAKAGVGILSVHGNKANSRPEVNNANVDLKGAGSQGGGH